MVVMKKTIIAVLMGLSLTFAPMAHAQVADLTPDERRSALITIIQQLIVLLEQEITFLNLESGTATSTPAVTTPTAETGASTPITPPVTSPVPMTKSISITSKIGPSIGLSGQVGDHISLTPNIVGAGAYPHIRVVTDLPSGFYKFNGAMGGEDPKAKDQTFEISADGSSGAITADATEAGTWSFTFSLADDPTVSTTVQVVIQ